MQFSLIPALGAGLMATLLMSLFSEIVSMKGITSMPTFPLILGTAFSGDRDAAMLIGSGLHYAVLGTVVYGVGYAMVFAVLGSASWWLGLVLGLVQGAVTGVVLGAVEDAHPRMVDAPGSADGTILLPSADRPEVALTKPGMFGVNWGDSTPAALMASYALYGLVFSIIYSMMV